MTSQQRQTTPYYQPVTITSQQPDGRDTIGIKPVTPKTRVYVLFKPEQTTTPTVIGITSDSSDAGDKDRAVREWIMKHANRIKPNTSIKVLNGDLTIWRGYSIAVDIKREPYDGTSST